jgi:uncharacterized protein (TIGR02231 family)
MKNLLRIILLIYPFTFSLTSAQSNYTGIIPVIEDVTVFQSGALINMSAGKQIEQGVTQIKFESLPSDIISNSIKVDTKSEISILSIRHQVNYLKEQKKPLTISTLEDSLSKYETDLLINQGYRNIYNEEKSMIFANKVLKPSSNTIFVEDLEDAAEFYRNRLSDIMFKMIELDKKEEIINGKINRVKMQLKEMNSKWKNPTGEIIVEVNSPKKTNAQFTLSFHIKNAGWQPVYEIKAKDQQSPVWVEYKANVFQDSGSDWDKVKMKLSTGNPGLMSAKPEIKPILFGKETTSTDSIQPTLIISGTNNCTDHVMNQQTYNQIYSDFTIPVQQSIPSDGKCHLVEIKSFDLQAKYEYATVPSVDLKVYLIAKTIGWTKTGMISGIANIYYGGIYTGTTFLNTQITNDTLPVSIGIDESIVVTRDIIVSKSEKNKKQRKETSITETVVKNKKSNIIIIEIEDQIPISSGKSVTIAPTGIENAQFDKETGKLKWKLTLNPSESKKIRFGYSVKETL